jgi:hypothetical protein
MPMGACGADVKRLRLVARCGHRASAPAACEEAAGGCAGAGAWAWRPSRAAGGVQGMWIKRARPRRPRPQLQTHARLPSPGRRAARDQVILQKSRSPQRLGGDFLAKFSGWQPAGAMQGIGFGVGQIRTDSGRFSADSVPRALEALKPAVQG